MIESWDEITSDIEVGVTPIDGDRMSVGRNSDITFFKVVGTVPFLPQCDAIGVADRGSWKVWAYTERSNGRYNNLGQEGEIGHHGLIVDGYRTELPDFNSERDVAEWAVVNGETW